VLFSAIGVEQYEQWTHPVDSPSSKEPVTDPDRLYECLLEVEPAFTDLAERAEMAGWSRLEVATALNGLAFARMTMLRQMEDGDRPH